MEILQKGNLELKKKPIQFNCRECNCIFIADKTEYQYCGDQREGDSWKCKCPTYGDIVYSVNKRWGC